MPVVATLVPARVIYSAADNAGQQAAGLGLGWQGMLVGGAVLAGWQGMCFSKMG